MSDHQEAVSQALPPHAQLIQMVTASWVSAVVYAAARLGLADQLYAEPKNASELAGSMRMHAPSLHRLMRTLASLGILTERDEQRFALTPLGEALKTGAPGAARGTLIAFGGTFWHGWEEILYSLETGNTGFHKAHGMPLFEYLSQHPAEASYFNEAMVGFHGNEPPAVARQPADGNPVESSQTARCAVRQTARGA
jgi:methyltransferase family protein